MSKAMLLVWMTPVPNALQTVFQFLRSPQKASRLKHQLLKLKANQSKRQQHQRQKTKLRLKWRLGISQQRQPDQPCPSVRKVGTLRQSEKPVPRLKQNAEPSLVDKATKTASATTVIKVRTAMTAIKVVRISARLAATVTAIPKVRTEATAAMTTVAQTTAVLTRQTTVNSSVSRWQHHGLTLRPVQLP